MNISDPAAFGDGTAGQMFVNLAHPGVRSRLSLYMAELAAYPGLEGIQIDYCRFPLDNNTGDVYPVPWSYDAWTRADFQTQGFGDPLSTAARSSRPNSSQWSQFVTYRKNGVMRRYRPCTQCFLRGQSRHRMVGGCFPRSQQRRPADQDAELARMVQRKLHGHRRAHVLHQHPVADHR